MARIQSNVGIITGVPITDTVDQLIAVSAQPRTRLINRNQGLQQQQLAVTQLTALVLGVQFAAEKLSNPSVFNASTVSSTNPSLITANVTGEPVLGDYEFTPVRQAQTHQLLGSGVASRTDPIPTGTLRISSGGSVDEAVSLETLNAGEGVQRGKIKITDRSGSSAVVDLRFAQTIDDVLQAINQTDDIDITAEATGDSIRLVDNTGSTSANLQVQESGGGSTAADLGLSGIDVASATATGQDILSLDESVLIERLNDGAGVSFNSTLADLSVSLADGTSLSIDFLAAASEGEEAGNELTLGDLIQTINAADPAKLQASISADGDRLELTDLTAGGGAFTVESALSGSVAEDLGLTGTAVGGVITGGKLLSGLKSSLLTSLSGGNGSGSLGDLQLTDRSGATATVDLSAAETLDQAIDAINTSGIGITASVNDARNGILIKDTSGGTGALIIESGDATDSAEALGIAVNDTVKTFDSGSLHRQTVSEQTLLSDLNGGRGVEGNSFIIEDSEGKSGAINIAALGIETVGDVIEAVNGLSLKVKARLNDSGDGILLVDTSGNGEISVRESGSGSAAADLHLLGGAKEIDIDGTLTTVIDGSTVFEFEIGEDESLEDLVDKINASNAGVSASIFADGSGATPFRLSLVSQTAGSDGELQIDARDTSLNFTEITKAQDALLLFGGSGSAGILASSTSNNFDSILDGVELNISGTSTSAVTVSVSQTSSQTMSNLQLFVDSYNKLRDALDAFTFFNPDDNTKGPLTGTNEALRVESEVSSLVTQRFFNAGPIQSLAEVGISINDKGKLSLDRDRAETKFSADAKAVEDFFTTETTGFSNKVSALIETLAGEGSSLLVNRAVALQARIDVNTERIDFFTARLDRERENLLTTFYNMESVIGKLQNNLSAIGSIQALAPLVASG